MTLRRETIVYRGPGGPFEGVAAWDDAVEGRRPAILVLPNVLGQKEADNRKADALAGLGYVALVADVYGQGKRTALSDPDYGRYMAELDADRALLQARLTVSLDALIALPQSDPDRLAAIGFCFGGKCVLDMIRSGLPIRGGVSFHGVYDPPPYYNFHPILAKLLVCHGWDDPLGPPDKIIALAEEMTASGVDWQLHAYGHAGHAFTDASRTGGGNVAYEPKADRRSWRAMENFVGELFG